MSLVLGVEIDELPIVDLTGVSFASVNVTRKDDGDEITHSWQWGGLPQWPLAVSVELFESARYQFPVSWGMIPIGRSTSKQEVYFVRSRWDSSDDFEHTFFIRARFDGAGDSGQVVDYDEVPCTCPCHWEGSGVMHIVACCENGMVRVPKA